MLNTTLRCRPDAHQYRILHVTIIKFFFQRFLAENLLKVKFFCGRQRLFELKKIFVDTCTLVRCRYKFFGRPVVTEARRRKLRHNAFFCRLQGLLGYLFIKNCRTHSFMYISPFCRLPLPLHSHKTHREKQNTFKGYTSLSTKD